MNSATIGALMIVGVVILYIFALCYVEGKIARQENEKLENNIDKLCSLDKCPKKFKPILEFSKFIYIDGGLYRLQKLIDYAPNENETTKAEFLRVIYTTY